MLLHLRKRIHSVIILAIIVDIGLGQTSAGGQMNVVSDSFQLLTGSNTPWATLFKMHQSGADFVASAINNNTVFLAFPTGWRFVFDFRSGGWNSWAFTFPEGSGADLLVEAGRLYEHDLPSSGWGWKELYSTSPVNGEGSISQLSFPRSFFPTNFNFFALSADYSVHSPVDSCAVFPVPSSTPSPTAPVAISLADMNVVTNTFTLESGNGHSWTNLQKLYEHGSEFVATAINEEFVFLASPVGWRFFVDYRPGGFTSWALSFPGGSGADYLVEAGRMYEHNLPTTEWGWREIYSAEIVSGGATMNQLRLPRSLFPSSFLFSATSPDYMLRAPVIGNAAFPAPAPTPSPTPSPTPASLQKGMSVLLLHGHSEDHRFDIYKDVFKGLGIPYDIVNASALSSSFDMSTLLYQSAGVTRYYGVVFSSSQLRVNLSSFESSLSPSQWNSLSTFLRVNSIRSIVAYEWWNPVHVPFASQVPSGSAVFRLEVAADPGLKPLAVLPLTDVSFARLTQNGRLVQLVNSPQYQTMVSVAEKNSNGQLTPIGSAAIRNVTSDTLYFTVDVINGAMLAPFSSRVLVNYGVQWMVRGIFLGKRRLHFNFQLDDLYLDTDQWAVGGVPENSVYKSSASDMVHMAASSSMYNSELPQGSNFTWSFAYNAAGAVVNYADLLSSPNLDDPLVNATILLKNSFIWIAHTWNHSLEETCREVWTASRRVGNQLFGGALHHEATAAVTPRISRMDDALCLHDTKEIGGYSILIGDTSRSNDTYLNPVDPYHGLWSPVNPGTFVVPRFPTDIFYNTSLPAQLAKAYSLVYPQFSPRRTIDEIIANNAIFIGSNLFGWRHDPYMLHQANVRVFPKVDAFQESNSLATLLAGKVFEYVAPIVSLPVVSWTQETMAGQLWERMGYDGAGVSAILTTSNNGLHSPLGIQLKGRSSSPVVIPVTGLVGPSPHTVESYGPDTTSYFTVEGEFDVSFDVSGPTKRSPEEDVTISKVRHARKERREKLT